MRISLALAMIAAPAAAQVPPVDQRQLMADVGTLSADLMQGRAVGTEGGALARGYIKKRFEQLGLQVEEQAFEFEPEDGGPARGVNLMARIPGTRHPDRWIVVTAHYDHVGIKDGEIHNGADDNASGVAALLAIAADLKRSPPQHSVLLVALDAEEPGLFGAKAMVETPPVPIENMLLNVNFDMLSRSGKGELYAAGLGPHPALGDVLRPVALLAPIKLRFGHDGHGSAGDDWTEGSDHFVFHEAGLPFVYFGVENHEDYHKPGDDIGKIDPGFFTGSAQTVALAVRSLDAAPGVLAEARRQAGEAKERGNVVAALKVAGLVLPAAALTGGAVLLMRNRRRMRSGGSR